MTLKTAAVETSVILATSRIELIIFSCKYLHPHTEMHYQCQGLLLA
jgi:hypothetical protein